MATSDPLIGATIYAQTDAALGGLQLADVVKDIVPFTVPSFSSTSARDTAFANWVAAGNTMRDNLSCIVAGTHYTYLSGTWIEMTSASSWTTFAPTWAATGGTPTIGNGTLIGRYRRMGRACIFRIELRTGSTTNGSTGGFTFTNLPFTANGGVEQAVLCKAYTNGNANWVGFALITGTTAIPYLPLGNSNTTLDQVRNADGTAAVGTGIPQVGGQFTFGGATTRNLIISGTYEIA